MSGLSPSSRKARAGFGPRVILRTRASRATKPSRNARLMLVDAREQPSQSFAGQQDQIVARAAVEPADPVEHRRGIRRIEDRDQRTAQHRRAAPLEHRGEHVQLARLGDGDRAAGESLLGVVSHGELARPARFELATFGFGGRHSIQLSYGRVPAGGGNLAALPLYLRASFRALRRTHCGAAVTAAHDKKFFDTFMLVLGILIGIAILLYVLARIVASDTQEADVQASPEMRPRDQRAHRAGREGGGRGPGQLGAGAGRSAAAAAQPTWAAKKCSTWPAWPATAPVSPAHRSSATRPRGDRASRRAPTRCTSTRSKASRARPASCRRRAARRPVRQVDHERGRLHGQRGQEVVRSRRSAPTCRAVAVDPQRHRLADMPRLDRLRLRQIRDRSRHFQYAVIRTRR